MTIRIPRRVSGALALFLGIVLTSNAQAQNNVAECWNAISLAHGELPLASAALSLAELSCVASYDAEDCDADLAETGAALAAAVAHNDGGAASCASASSACSAAFDTFSLATTDVRDLADDTRTICAGGESVFCSLAIESTTEETFVLQTQGASTMTECESAPAAPLIGTASVVGNSTTATVTFTAPALDGGSPITGYAVTRSGGGTTACAGSPCDVTDLADGSYTFTAMAFNAIGPGPASAASNSVTVDTIAPDTGFTSTPTSPSTAHVSFSFTSADGTATFECSLDSAAFAPCASPQTITGLASGSHTFEVRATDAVGNVEASPASHTWTVDADNPAVSGVVRAAGFANPTDAGSVDFTVIFSEPVQGVDAADFSVVGTGSVAGAAITAATPIPPGVGAGHLAWTVTVSTGSGSGTIGLEVLDDDSIVDEAGNPLGGVGSGVHFAGGETFTLERDAPPAITTHTGPSATGSGIISAVFTGGGATCSFDLRQFIPVSGHGSSPPAGSAPQGVVFPHGLFDFTLVDCTQGSTVTMTITYPTALPAGTRYWKYGPTPTNASPHWYELPATINGTSATFSITDGGLGDDDLMANGSIIDQGGPGAPGANATLVPTLSVWAMIGLGSLMLLLVLGPLRRSASMRRA